MELHEGPVKVGRYILHYHPARATSWQLGRRSNSRQWSKATRRPGIKASMAEAMTQGTSLKQPTRFMSNSVSVLAGLDDR